MSEQEKTEVEEKFRLRSIIVDEDAMFLRKESEPVSFGLGDSSGRAYLDGDTNELIQALKEYILEHDGLGMAAIQLGVQKRLFVMRKPWNSDNLLVVINPEIVNVHGKSKKVEGCFSLPMPDNMGAYVERPSQIDVRYLDKAGETHEDTLFGMDARVFLHEFDHLQGKLMVDEPHFQSWRRLF